MTHPPARLPACPLCLLQLDAVSSAARAALSERVSALAAADQALTNLVQQVQQEGEGHWKQAQQQLLELSQQLKVGGARRHESVVRHPCTTLHK